ncbi:OLC1v1031858C1 [Oldenlandia corymbosa var. corymbosa]|uniref:OLC1v1031858C1 n=1 Tax=Oldenlandia corymbosa var. corymbosa TaxID=529605 RepID=A0AAV1CLI6_OLDCO|nr:OLC1v1031858C1 [Oldenlandia corymbosa var. corymbosa]
MARAFQSNYSRLLERNRRYCHPSALPFPVLRHYSYDNRQMANRTNFYKNPSHSYNKQLHLNSVLQNLQTYNIAIGNAPRADEPAVQHPDDEIRRHRKRRRVWKPAAPQKNEVEENGGPMSHQEYIDKMREEFSSDRPYQELTEDVLGTSTSTLALQLVADYDSDSDTDSSGETQKKQDSNSNPVVPFELPMNKKSPPISDRIKRRSEQRLPLPGEPTCVVCGKYGEYICDETDDDICSIDCKDEVLKNIQSDEGDASCKNVAASLCEESGLNVPDNSLDPCNLANNGWSNILPSFSTYKCLKCQRPGHFAEDCLVTTSECHSSSLGNTCSEVPYFPVKPLRMSRNLLELYKRCHQIGKTFLTAKCSVCRGSTTLASCLKCSNAFCDSAGHLIEHIRAHPSHQEFYSFRLKRLVKCCKPTCQVTEIKDLLACHYCFNKAFDKFYDMYTATWKAAGLSIIWGSICCDDHFECIKEERKTMVSMMAEPATERSVMAVIRAARPSFRNANDKVAFAVHATLFASGFVLRATGPAAFSHSETNPPSGVYKEVGIDQWNQLDANYAFVYSKSEVYANSNNLISLEKIVVKCLALDGMLHIDALRKGVNLKPDVIARLDIKVADHVPPEANNGGNPNYNNNDKNNYGSMFKNLGKLVRDVHNEIVSKFTGGPLVSTLLPPFGSNPHDFPHPGFPQQAYPLSALLVNEAKLLGGLGEEIQGIVDELGQMKAFLMFAEGREEEDPRLQEWIFQVQDVAYDIQDVVDEFMMYFGRIDRHGFLSEIQDHKCRNRHTVGANSRSSFQVISSENSESQTHKSRSYSKVHWFFEECRVFGSIIHFCPGVT